jgi:hypothetical protein
VLHLLSGAIAIDTETHNDLIPEVQRQIFVIISIASTHSFELVTAAFVFINALVSDLDEDIVGGTELRESLLHKGLARIIMVYFCSLLYPTYCLRLCHLSDDFRN